MLVRHVSRRRRVSKTKMFKRTDTKRYRRRRMNYLTAQNVEKYVERVYEDLTLLYRSEGHNQYDPDVSHMQHALMSAALAKQRCMQIRTRFKGTGFDLDTLGVDENEFVVSALLHDVGHLITREHRHQHDFLQKNKKHEMIGANYLKRHGFSKLIYLPVQLHVQSKRFMQTLILHPQSSSILLDCAHFMNRNMSQGFSDSLFEEIIHWETSCVITENSEKSLVLQGGQMNNTEILTFIHNKYSIQSLILRAIDNTATQCHFEAEHVPKWYAYEELVKNVLRDNILNTF